MASLPMPLHSMLRGHLRRANHDDGGDQYDDDDDGDDLYLTGSELGWNLSLSGLIIIGVIVFMFKFGIDPPVRADGSGARRSGGSRRPRTRTIEKCRGCKVIGVKGLETRPETLDMCAVRAVEEKKVYARRR